MVFHYIRICLFFFHSPGYSVTDQARKLEPEKNTLDSLSVNTSFYSKYTYVDYIQYTYWAQYSNIVGVLMAATANSWDVQTANHSLIAKAYAQKLSHGIDNNKNQLMPTQSYSYIAWYHLWRYWTGPSAVIPCGQHFSDITFEI